MVAIAFTESTLLTAKRALSSFYPSERSSHLTEALASACGYGTHAALLSVLKTRGTGGSDFVVLDGAKFCRRLNELTGRKGPKHEGVRVFDHLLPPRGSEVIRTWSRGGETVHYRSLRQKAWRNAIVSAINAGIQQQLFSILPGDNRWTTSNERGAKNGAQVFQFMVDSIPAIGSVSDAGFDELSIHVAFWPTQDAERWIVPSNAGFLAGELFATGWLERRAGAWLQTPSKVPICCRRGRLTIAAALDVAAAGYADRGSFVM